MGSSGFRLEDVGGVRVARCDALSSIVGIAHAFSTRIAHDGDAFDLGPARDAAPDVERRRGEFLLAAGIAGREVAVLTQVHGARVVAASAAVAEAPEADACTTAIGAGPPAAVRAADCVPILLVDRKGAAAAAVHAGWRGTAAGVAGAAVAALEANGAPASSLVAALGPAIGGCCYEVGPEVIAALSGPSGDPASFTRRAGPSRTTVDLHEANARQLVAAGVSEGAIHRAPWCTRCRNDLFFSVRAEGASAGRLMAAVGRSRRP